MTREEAIQVLSQRPMIAQNKSNRQKMLNEAIDMAIESLQSDTVPIQEVKLKDGFKIDDIDENYEPKIVGNAKFVRSKCEVTDPISRAEVHESCEDCPLYDKERHNCPRFNKVIPRTIAETVQGWVPCSERLPKESGDYLCTIPLDADETYTEVLTFHKGRFYEDDDEWGATYHDDVLAWMPLPEPYREDGEDE